MKRPQPLTLWLTGIAILVALLIVGGGYHRPLVFVIVALVVVGMIAGFLLARRAR